MKENLLEVLVYLFEHFIYDEPEASRDRDSLQASLVQAGFAPAEISRAFDWLDELERQRPDAATSVVGTAPVRVYATQESDRLDTACRGFLIFLEQQGVLDAQRRELVLDRVMALGLEEIDLEDLKWVVLMVLFNQPGQEANYAWMEDLMFDTEQDYRH